MDEDSFRALDEFHAQHDPIAQLHAIGRLVSHALIAAYSDRSGRYDRAGHARAIAVWQTLMPALIEPKPPAKASFAGEHLSWAGRGALEVCRIIAAQNPGKTDTWIAREAAKVLHARFVDRPRYEILEITWRCERMPRTVDPATNTITTRCGPAMVERIRKDVEARFGAVLQWSVQPVQKLDPATFDRDPEDIDESLFRKIKRLLDRSPGHADL